MTPLSGYVGYALRRAQGVIFADFNHTLAELDLRPAQFAVLVMIDQNPGTSQSSVSAALGIQKANFVAIIADLDKRGFVRRRKSHSDGRTYSLGLTPRGRAQLQRAAELHPCTRPGLSRKSAMRGVGSCWICSIDCRRCRAHGNQMSLTGQPQRDASMPARIAAQDAGFLHSAVP